MEGEQYLQTFITNHERKLNAKVAATAVIGRFGLEYRRSAVDRMTGMMTQRNYRAILGRRHMAYTGHCKWPMHYEELPRG